jgi:hypothetical protein
MRPMVLSHISKRRTLKRSAPARRRGNLERWGPNWTSRGFFTTIPSDVALRALRLGRNLRRVSRSTRSGPGGNGALPGEASRIINDERCARARLLLLGAAANAAQAPPDAIVARRVAKLV